MKHIYPKELEKEIIKSKYIPRKFQRNERMKLYHKYWVPLYEGVVKVDDIMMIDNVEYYFIKYSNKMVGCTTYPLYYNDAYELLHNYDSIEKDQIINSNKSYSGAEIKFWFILNRINFDNSKYKGFWPFVNPYSMNVIADNKYYFVVNNKDKMQQFQMVLDKSKM